MCWNSFQNLFLSTAKPIPTPMDSNTKLTSKDYGNLKNSNNTHDPLFIDVRSYKKLIGKLLYLTVTRPHISYGVKILSQYIQRPKKIHMEATLRIARYIKNQPG